MKKVSIKLIIVFLFISTFILSLVNIKSNIKAEELYVNKKVIDASEVTGDDWKGTPTIQGINHANWASSSTPVTISKVSNSSSFKMSFNRGGQYHGSNAVLFDEAYEINEITKITFSVYLHLSPSGACDWDSNMGVYLYSTSASGFKGSTIATDGFSIDKNTKEDEWIDIEITGDNINIFANNNGKFNGFQMGARHNGTPDVTAYNTGNYIAVRNVTIQIGNYKTITLNYGIDGMENGKVKVLYNSLLEVPSYPLRLGYEFVGWQKDSVNFDFSTPITSDFTLNAVWKVTDKVQVYFNSNGGSSVASKYATIGEKIEEPVAPTKLNNVFDGWFLNGVRFDFNTPITDNIELIAKWRDLETNLTNLNSDYELTPSALIGVNGTSAQSVNTQQYGCGEPMWETSSQLGDKDSHAFQMFFHSYGLTRSFNGIKFNIEVNPEDIMGITFRFKCHFSSSSTYDTSLGGVILYALDATGMSQDSGYMIPANVKQDEWIELTLIGSDMKKIADQDGIIRGFQVGLNVHAPDNMSFYVGSYGQRSSYLAFDGASVSRKIRITYEYGDNTKTVDGATGIPMEHFYPDVDGKVFIGWKNKETDEDVNNQTKFDWDATLVASFENKENLPDGTYYNENVNGTIGEGSYVFVKNSIADLTDIFSEEVKYQGFANGRIVAFLSNGEMQEIFINNENYKAVETYKVTINTGRAADSYVVDVCKNKKINQPVIEKIGYTLVGFMLNNQMFDFNNPITSDMELKAYYEFSEIENQNWYQIYTGKYYSNVNDLYYVLNLDKTYSIVKNNETLENGNYLVLNDGVVVFISSTNTQVEATINGSMIETDNDMLQKVSSYLINFDSKGGSLVESVRIDLECGYLVKEPSVPNRDGYDFLGWYTSDGEKFDFSKKQLESITLYAKWARKNAQNQNENDNPDNPKHKKGCKNSISLIAFVPLLSVITIVAYKKKENI